MYLELSVSKKKKRKLILHLFKENETDFYFQMSLLNEAERQLRILINDEKKNEVNFQLNEKGRLTTEKSDVFKSMKKTKKVITIPYSEEVLRIIELVKKAEEGELPTDVRTNINDTPPISNAQPSLPTENIQQKPWE